MKYFYEILFHLTCISIGFFIGYSIDKIKKYKNKSKPLK